MDVLSDRHKAKMNTMMFLPLLLLEMMVIPVMSRLNSVTVISYIKGRKVLKGEVIMYRCAGHSA